MKGAWILLVMLVVAWVPPVAQGGRDVFRWEDAAGVVHYADRPDAAGARRMGPRTVRRPQAAPAPDCAHIREQLARAARAGRRLGVRALEEQLSDACH